MIKPPFWGNKSTPLGVEKTTQAEKKNCTQLHQPSLTLTQPSTNPHHTINNPQPLRNPLQPTLNTRLLGLQTNHRPKIILFAPSPRI